MLIIIIGAMGQYCSMIDCNSSIMVRDQQQYPVHVKTLANWPTLDIHSTDRSDVVVWIKVMIMTLYVWAMLHVLYNAQPQRVKDFM